MSNPSSPLYYEDLEVGRVYQSGTLEVTAEEMVQFARRYDPQPFHVDGAAAETSIFGGLVASGWLTAALTMRRSESRPEFGVVQIRTITRNQRQETVQVLVSNILMRRFGAAGH